MSEKPVTTCKKHSYVGGGDKDRHFIKCKVCGQEESEKGIYILD